MGPVRGTSEALSAYRFRYALYCGAWLMTLGSLLALFWSYRGELLGSFIGMFLLFGLPIGAATAFVAMVGFLIGGAFRRYAETSLRAAMMAERAKVSLAAFVMTPLGLFGIYVAGRSLISQSVPMLGRSRAVISYGEDPLGFGIVVTLWAAVGVAILLGTAKKVRQAYAT